MTSYALDRIYNKWVTDCQKNIKKPVDDRSTVDATAATKPIGGGLLITTVASTIVGIFYALWVASVGQTNASLTSTSLAWLMSLLVWKMKFFWSDDKKPYTINE